MEFTLSREQNMIKELVRDFATKEIKPLAIELDREAKFSEHLFKRIGELGLLGIPFPEKYGGSGADTISYAIAVEEIGKVCGGTGLSYAAAVSLGASPIYYFGTEAQKQEFLVPLASGKGIASFGLTEPNAGSDAGGTQTKAELVGDEYIINGEKCWITNASYAKTVTVTAVTGKDEREKNIISAFLVPVGTPGMTITSPYEKMGVRASDTTQIVLENVRVRKKIYLEILKKALNNFYIH